jgi:hypothetical protein
VKGLPRIRDGRAGLVRFARDTFGRAGFEEIRRAQCVLSNVPVAAVWQHLQRREPPRAIVGRYRGGGRRSG